MTFACDLCCDEGVISCGECGGDGTLPGGRKCPACDPCGDVLCPDCNEPEEVEDYHRGNICGWDY